MIKNINDKDLIKDVDEYVSRMIKIRRSIASMTQKELAKLLGISFQQVQKYESGTSRITSGILFKLAKMFDCRISNFFPVGRDFNINSVVKMADSALDENIRNDNNEVFDKDLKNLIKFYYSIKDLEMRKNAINILKTMAENQ